MRCCDGEGGGKGGTDVLGEGGGLFFEVLLVGWEDIKAAGMELELAPPFDFSKNPSGSCPDPPLASSVIGQELAACLWLSMKTS